MLLTSTGATIDHAIDVAVESPDADLDCLRRLMALIGLYVGVIPVGIGMLWLPLRCGPSTLAGCRFLMALTIGLLASWASTLGRGPELAGEGPARFGGAALVFLGAAGAYIALAGVDAWLRQPPPPRRVGLPPAFLVALRHRPPQPGEGLAIGSAYAVGRWRSARPSWSASHSQHTEGLAIVAPAAREGKVSLPRLAALGLLAGAPAVLGAWIGASAFHPSLAGLMFGIGAGAIAQVIVQIAPSIRDRDGGPLLSPLVAGGLLCGLVVMYATGLMVSV